MSTNTKYTDQEVYGILGCAIDFTRMSQLVWHERSDNVFQNNKSHIIIGKKWSDGEIQCLKIEKDGNSTDITEQGGELVKRLFDVAEKSAAINHHSSSRW